MNICIIIPGFIKEYQFLKAYERLFQNIHADKIYVFGHIFSYTISPKTRKEKTQYDNNNNNNNIDTSKLSIFDSFSFVSDDYEKYDEYGYDNRIYSQWYNIRKSFDLYLDFSKKHNIKCDIFIRMRSDLHIVDIDRLNNIIKKTHTDNKMIFFTPSCHIVNDQFFIGTYTLFNKIMLLSDNIYDYYLLDEMKERIIEHEGKKKPFNEYLRFGGESEILLWTHINKYIDRNDLLLIKNNGLFRIKKN